MNSALLTGIRMMLAGVICFLCYQAFNWPEGYWSVVTVSAITQATLSDTMVKALLRLIGTCIGAFIGFAIVLIIPNNPFWISTTFGIFITFTTFIGLQTKPYNYAPIVAGFTTVIIISSIVLGDIEAVAWYRTLEVLFGIFIYALINLAVLSLKWDDSPIFDYQIKEKIKKAYSNIQWNRYYVISALVISIPTTLTYLSWLVWRYPYGFWATVTLVIIMEDTFTQTQGKSLVRFLGQTLAAVVGLFVAFYANGSLAIIGVALAIGFFICGYIIGSGSKMASIGNPAGIAIAIILLVGIKDGTSTIIFYRFLNVCLGILIANMVMLLYQHYSRCNFQDARK